MSSTDSAPPEASGSGKTKQAAVSEASRPEASRPEASRKDSAAAKPGKAESETAKTGKAGKAAAKRSAGGGNATGQGAKGQGAMGQGATGQGEGAVAKGSPSGPAKPGAPRITADRPVGAAKLAQGARRYLDGKSASPPDPKAAAEATARPQDATKAPADGAARLHLTTKGAEDKPVEARGAEDKRAGNKGAGDKGAGDKGGAEAKAQPGPALGQAARPQAEAVPKGPAAAEPAPADGRSEDAKPGNGAAQAPAPAKAPAAAPAVAPGVELAVPPAPPGEGEAAGLPAVAEADEGPFEDPLASCLSFLSKVYGRAYDESQLRAGIALENGRLNFDGMLEAAERIGCEATPEQCRLGKIPRLALPAIALLKDDRACVILRFTAKGAVEVYDPRAGHGTTMVALSELESLYSGQIVYIRPQFRFDNRSEVAAIETAGSWFWGSLLQNWWIYGHAVLATVIVNFLAIASPIFIMTVYDRVVPNNAVETLWVLAFGIAGVALFDFCLRTLRAYLVDVAGKRIDVHLGSRLFDHVVRLRMDSRNASAGSLASIMREFDFLREFLSSATVTAIGDLPFIFLFIFVIYLIGGPIAYVPMVVVPIVLIVSMLIQIPLHKVTRDSMKEVTQKNAHLFEVLHGIETIKAIRAETWAQRNWEQLVGLTATSSMKMKMLSQIGTHTTMTAQLLTTVGIVVVGVHVLREGDITQGALIACVLLSSRVMAPLAQVAGVLVRYEQTKTAFNALQDIMKAPVERAPGKKLVHKPFLKGDIEVKEVSFSYPQQETNALNAISFKVKAGEHVAIIGRVGSGKSTVLKLVQNLYEPADGFVRVDDLDTRQIELADLRRQVGYTPQETMLFHGTIRDNLVQGAPHATDEQVMTAAHLAGLDDMIKGSPKGLDQEVGEHGTLLSGGQRQMIVLARALVLDPPILLMDEPTSHMDNFGERQFIGKMKDWLQGRTMVLVTHRATLLALVDRLIVMDKGQIVADGPKEEVLNALAAGKIGAAQT